MNGDWLVYRNVHHAPDETAPWSLAAPPWRRFADLPEDPKLIAADPSGGVPQDFYYLASKKIIATVNAALRLRRPILVTGAPGTGKTTLAYSIAQELGLGPVLPWLITSRSTLREGMYEYDVLGRVNDMNLADRATARATASGRRSDSHDAAEFTEAAIDIGRYITLGPLGDALLPRSRPRVLLVDEIDKCDIDLPGDLLHVFERGWYEIPELVRERERDVKVRRAGGREIWIRDGQVRCHQFPVIVLTSNEEREFPPAFRRRCLHVELELPGPEELRQIATEKLRTEPGRDPLEPISQKVKDLIGEFKDNRGDDGRVLAADQLLNALYLRLPEQGLTDSDFASVREIVLASLGQPSGDLS